jgi:uncharacterized protein YjbJ (UPF0337 family)
MNNDKQQDKPAQDNAKLNAKIKETWSKLSDADVALCSSNRQQFLGKLKEHYQLSNDDATKKIKALEESCGCGTTNKAA